MSFSRRRFLSISAAALGFATSAHAELPVAKWRGIAMGAPAELQLVGLPSATAVPIFEAVEAELRRLEDIFSLYRPLSAISRLNRDGRLEAPPLELLEVLSLCDRLHRASDGMFDPTVQPLFLLHADAVRMGRNPTSDERAEANGRIGWINVRFGAARVVMARKGAALTLNGIAQGYITDRIAGLLRDADLTDVLVDIGEIRAIGRSSDGDLWQAGIRAPSGDIVARVRLHEHALATSQPKRRLGGLAGHIFQPETGSLADGAELVSVTAPTAAIADGLSTALAILPPQDHEACLTEFPGAARTFLM